MILAAAQVYYARKGAQLAGRAVTGARSPDNHAHMTVPTEPVVVASHSVSARSVGLRVVWGPILLGWAIGMSITRHDYLFYPHFNLLLFVIAVAVLIPLVLSPWGRRFLALLGLAIVISVGLYQVIGPWAPLAAAVVSTTIWEMGYSYSSANDILGAVGMIAAAIICILAFRSPSAPAAIFVFCVGATAFGLYCGASMRRYRRRRSLEEPGATTPMDVGSEF